MLISRQMYSLSYLYQSMGDNNFADRCELAAFNALPVMVCGFIGTGYREFYSDCL